MNKVIQLPNNLIGQEDHERLESFGAHEISLGRVTRYHWDKNGGGDPVFEIYRDGAEEEFTFSISRDREKDVFHALDAKAEIVVSGNLDHVISVLDMHLVREHQENI